MQAMQFFYFVIHLVYAYEYCVDRIAEYSNIILQVADCLLRPPKLPRKLTQVYYKFELLHVEQKNIMQIT